MEYLSSREAATKHAVTASSEVLSPGKVRTELSTAAGRASAEVVYQIIESLNPEDVSECVLYILSTPLHVQLFHYMVTIVITYSH